MLYGTQRVLHVLINVCVVAINFLNSSGNFSLGHVRRLGGKLPLVPPADEILIVLALFLCC